MAGRFGWGSIIAATCSSLVPRRRAAPYLAGARLRAGSGPLHGYRGRAGAAVSTVVGGASRTSLSRTASADAPFDPPGLGAVTLGSLGSARRGAVLLRASSPSVFGWDGKGPPAGAVLPPAGGVLSRARANC